MANRPVVSNLDFDTIKSDIISYFKSKPEFSDYEFTGSALNLLIEILAYNTHYNSLAANLMLNEMFLDSANVRSSVTSIAKMLNYVPRSSRSAKTSLTLVIPRQSTERTYLLPAGSVFTAKSGNTSAKFYTIRDYTVQFESTDTSKQITVEAYAGKLISQRFSVKNNPNGFVNFNLNSKKIDLSTLVVSVNGTKYKQISPEDEGVTATSGESLIYFVEENRNGSYDIIFGNGVIGKALEVNDEVICTFVDSTEDEGNGISNFAASIIGRADVSVVSATVSQGGDTPESVYEIKQNAPHWFQSQYRAVTENDYAVMLKKKYADIQSINVYGGEKVNIPGKVFIAIRPKSSDTLTQSTKTTLINEIIGESNIMTVTPQIVDPFYVDIIFKTVVTYDDDKLTTNVDTLKAKVLTMYDVLNTTYLGEFASSMSESSVSKEVFSLDDAITSVNQRVQLQVSITTANNLLDFYNYSYLNRLYHPEAGYKASTGGILSSSLFQIEGDDTNFYGLDEDGIGNIRLYKWIDNTKEYTSSFIGSINYNTGQIDLSTKLRVQDASIQIKVTPDSFDVIAENDTILRINTGNTLVEAIEYRDTNVLRNINVSRSA